MVLKTYGVMLKLKALKALKSSNIILLNYLLIELVENGN